MRSRRRVGATAISVAAFFLCCILVVVTGRARAGDDEDARIMLVFGQDLWRNGVFGYGGFVWAPWGFDRDGLLLKILLSNGLYRYNAGNFDGERVTGTELLWGVMPGWRIKRGRIQGFLRPRNSAAPSPTG
jgi:Cellulose biosynthesis protein BcsS